MIRAGPSKRHQRHHGHIKWRGGANSVLATPSENHQFLVATPWGGSDQPCVGRKKEDKRKEGILLPAANDPYRGTITGSTSRDHASVDKPFPATAQDRESMSFLRLRREDSSNNSNQ